MVSWITLSRNELWALLIKVFEALYGHNRDYHDMARIALWLECHGHGGIDLLTGALSILEQKDLKKPEWIEISPAHSVLEGHGRSLFCMGSTACDLVMAQAASAGEARLDLNTLSDPAALIALLPNVSRQGFAAALLWPEGLAVMAPHQGYPVIYKGHQFDQISLICAKNEDILQKYLRPEMEEIMSADKQLHYDAVCLEAGVKVLMDKYNLLNVIADRVLVESSEESRRGAGE